MDAINIEYIRHRYNPVQRKLIDSHVTLCREDEISDPERVMLNLEILEAKRITIPFGQVRRFDNESGVLIPARSENLDFHSLRRKILAGIIISPRHLEPHITLMHPRNSTCTDEIFNDIKKTTFPSVITFDQISLIEQINGGPWRILASYNLS
jgi:hypothetical protein